MIGIYDCFGYGPGYDVSFEERYELIKQAGFDCVMLWWSDQFGRGEGYQNDVRLARNAGLTVENIHAPVHEQNSLSSDDGEGESVFQSYLQAVWDCDQYGIPTVVIHLPDDTYPINELGMRRLEALVSEAEKRKIQLAFENLRNIRNLTWTLDMFSSKWVGICYDSCHHANYAPDVHLLEQFGDRLMALHLQDNGGQHNQHRLPFDGSIDWARVMGQLAGTGYQGATCLEPMNWDYSHLSIREFLALAFQKAKRLDDMRMRLVDHRNLEGNI